MTYSVFTEDAAGHVSANPVKLSAVLVASSKARAFTAVYVLPKCTAAKNRTAAIRRDITLINNWYKGQTPGRVPRFVRSHGVVTVTVVHLPVTSATLFSTKTDGIAVVTAAIAQAKIPGYELPVAYIEGGWKGYGGACGVEGGPIALLWMANCGGIYPSTKDIWPYGATYLTAHEMTHAMGAVANCAPHSTGDGHVNDSNRDILYEGPSNKPWTRDWTHLVLDYKHNDYYDNHTKGCPGITNDTVWVKA